MSGRVALARRNLFEDRRRSILAIGGVGAGLLVVLVMNGIFAGFTKQATAYLSTSPADVIVSQSGVKTMQMSMSVLPAGTVARVRAVPGVAWAEPLRQTTSTIATPGGQHLISYVFGFDPDGGRGGPQTIVVGRTPGAGEIAIDRAGAEQLHVGIGDAVEVFGRPLTVSALTSGLTSIANTTVFMTGAEYARLAGAGVNYVLVGAEPGTSAADLRERLAGTMPAATVQTHAEFAAQEGALVQDMYTDVIRTMIFIGFVIALALVALTLSAVTSAKLREYGVLKALGATRPHLARVVATQAMWAVLAATAVATALAVLLALVVGVAVPNVALVIEPDAVLITGVGSLVVGAPAALLPLRRVLQVDPATAFRGAL